MKKMGRSVYPKQPLLVHRQLVARVQLLAHITIQIPELNYVSRSPNSPYWQSQPFIYLIPELCETTGFYKDITHLGILLPTIIDHIRCYTSISILENLIGIEFNDKALIRKVLKHCSTQFHNYILIF